ncbi:UDP-N-acetylmuramoyl-L-alanyl-D-glutamate--2,6-diaminopimelate ligase [Bacillus taeanensis]|uniref:UDP-N-acetylmuramoyl-L-alanyl-D-glutamate--2,6-diaminopimelate ligase n=1 Tax=Bacillus taeanensis TaxID=273032 RepID=A0A366Y1W7_9BACI|nr:UDP-N-acetylmuramoyl-L-alanyl-D-glutamate--2,6-diaminopimelate ligase [Bacillus taeanensis]RBW70394.1 UDP-N-acetylmuramoyl-L-alanyl-D-glutamate--2,6-diaminopimelate ligase [Bacillus taeanensis]
MKLHNLTQYLLSYQVLGEGNPAITSIEMDSREVKSGSLFICIKGFTVDGHNFVNQAIEKGAAAILAEKEIEAKIPVIVVSDTKRAMALLADVYYNHPTHHMHLIGVTGTNGKTTTTYLIDQIMEDSGRNTGRIGTINMKINDKEFEMKNTTPESLFLQKAFHDMITEHVETAVMEVSSHALDLGRVRGCDFDVAVFTNLTQDHLDYHQNMETYLQAKALLFSQLGNTYDKNRSKVAVLNVDDSASKTLERVTSAQVLTYGIENEADIMAVNIVLSGDKTKFVLQTKNDKVNINLHMVGKFSIYNALAAASACLASGVSLQQIKASLEKVQGVPGRFEVVKTDQPFTVIVDYAHTPDSLENVLLTAKEFAVGKVYVVVGCGGDRDRTKRPLMANIAVEHADYAFFTSDNPRSEEPEQILRDMTNNLTGEYSVIVDRKKAICEAIHHAKQDDVIIIAGKGHETYQIIGDKVHDFDDRLVAEQAIKELKS